MNDTYESDKTIDDAPVHLNNEQAQAWLDGYNAAYNDVMTEWAEDEAGADL